MKIEFPVLGIGLDVVTLEEFIERARLLDKREALCPTSGLKGLYWFIDDIPALNRLWLMLQIKIHCSQSDQAGYFWMFRMHRTMRKILRRAIDDADNSEPEPDQVSGPAEVH